MKGSKTRRLFGDARPTSCRGFESGIKCWNGLRQPSSGLSARQTNLAYNALDYHVKRGWGGHTALIYFNERGERRIFTYAQLLYEVERVAAALRGMGINKGDRLTIYMPTCPEAIILMLATVRIGAIHSVVFAGFGAKALGDRIQASGSRLVFTADVTYRKGKDTRLKEIVDEALQSGRRKWSTSSS